MNRRFALFAVAFLVALASTGAVFSYVSKVDARALAGQQPTEVLVIVEKVEAGMRAEDILDNDLATLKTVARGNVPPGAVSDAKSIAGQVTLTDMFPGEMVLEAKLGTEAPPNSGALTIPEGKLAVSVTLEDPESVAGFITPGAEVAIFDTFNVFPKDAGSGQTPSGDRLTDDYDKNRATRLLLPRTAVLAVDAKTSVKSAAGDEAEQPVGGAAPVKTVALTLAVTQKEAEKLIHAAETGSLWFGLLSPTSTTAPSEGVDSRRLFN